MVCVWRRTYRGTTRTTGSRNSNGATLTLKPKVKEMDKEVSRQVLTAYFMTRESKHGHFVPRNRILGTIQTSKLAKTELN